MKALDIALKDLLRSARSASLFLMMFVIPLLITGMFYFAFGGMTTDAGSDLPATRVQVANLDDPGAQYGGFSAGQTLVDVLQSEDLADLVQVTEASSADEARAAVDRQEAGVAVIIPADFTAVALGTQGSAAIEVYRDPTLTMGPAIVESIVAQFVDGFAGARIAADVAGGQLAAQGLIMDEAARQAIAMQYSQWAAALGQQQGGGLVDVYSPAVKEETIAQKIVRLVMAGMMVFYLFFTGANLAQTILREEADGTLQRLLTTPVRHSTILSGKFLAALFALLGQITVLLTASALIFGIDWGDPLPVALTGLALVLLAAGFGFFIISLLKDVRQTGVIIGGVMTVAGMLGMLSIFSAANPNASGAISAVSLVVPQGWAVRAWKILLEGGGLGDVLPTIGVMLLLGIVFLAIGLRRFQKRFA